MQHKLIVENWRKYIKSITENEEDEGWQDLDRIFTVGELVQWFRAHETNQTLSNMFSGRVAKWAAKAGSVAVGIGTALVSAPLDMGASGVAAASATQSTIEDSIEKFLISAIYSLAMMPDTSSSYPEGSAAKFFDLNDTVQMFLRSTEHGGNVNDPSTIEIDSIKKFRDYVQEQIKSLNIGSDQDQSWKDVKLADIIEGSAQEVLDKNLLDDHSVDVEARTGQQGNN